MFSLNRKLKYYSFLFVLISISCSGTSTTIKPVSSIFEEIESLTILAETFPEYEWNDEAKNAYSIYLTGLNDFYFRKQYETAKLLFYNALDVYPYDARFYVRLAESQARTGDFPTAINTLTTAETFLTGFLANPGVASYLDYLNQAAAGTVVYVPPKSILSKTTGAITWIPRKAYGFIRNLF